MLMLGDTFNLTTLEDIDNAEQAILSDDFHIVLLDMQSKAYDSLALCKLIASHSLSSPPLVVALGDETNEETVRAIFNAGAYDYFIKPYNIVLFYESLQKLVNTIQEYKEIEQNDKESRDTVNVTLTQASYYGFAFDLLPELSRTDSFESLAQAVLAAMTKRGIHCALQITDIEGKLYTFEDEKDVIGERTLQVFQYLRNQGRIYRFGKRLVFNDENVSLFVKTMDDTSSIAYDCVLDIGAKLIPIIELQLRTIREHQILFELQSDMQGVVAKLHHSLAQQTKRAEQIVANIAGQINMSFGRLDLNEFQETFFIQLIETELQIDFKNTEFEALEKTATQIYDKILAIQNKPKIQELHKSQYSDIDFF